MLDKIVQVRLRRFGHVKRRQLTESYTIAYTIHAQFEGIGNRSRRRQYKYEAITLLGLTLTGATDLRYYSIEYSNIQ